MRTLSVACVLAMAGSAFAIDTINIDRSTMLLDNGVYTIQATPMDQAIPTSRSAGPVYSNLDPGPNGYVAAPAASGTGGFDDYVSTLAPGNVTLAEFSFVGGTSVVGGAVFFDFFDANQNFVDGFGVQLSQAGNFIWTITINVPFDIPGAGLVQVFFDDGSVISNAPGQWFLGDAGPTIGTEDSFLGGAGNGTFSHNFELVHIPAPGAIALMGLAGLAATRRRR